MSKFNSSSLSPGMVLGEDIYLPDGRLLMKKGTILDFEHLRSVRVGGVKEVEILDTLDPDYGSGAISPSVPDIHHTGEKAPWETRFSKCDLNHPVIQELYRLAAATLSQAGRSESFHYLMEQTFLGFDHLQVGLALAAKWKLPLSLQQAIGGHHDPLKYHPSVDTAVVNMADNLVNALGYGSSGEHLVAPGWWTSVNS